MKNAPMGTTPLQSLELHSVYSVTHVSVEMVAMAVFRSIGQYQRNRFVCFAAVGDKHVCVHLHVCQCGFRHESVAILMIHDASS